MKKHQFLSFILFTGLMSVAHSADLAAENKVLNTKKFNDYGILTKLDYKDDTISKTPFDPNAVEFFGKIYWQCFPRQNVTIELIDLGTTAEELEQGETYGLLSLKTYREEVEYNYLLRRAQPTSSNLDRFLTWQSLLKKEDHICIAGSSPTLDQNSNLRNHRKTILWYFERIKTKKGCDSYFRNKYCTT